jgi:hypothetical protein
MTAKDSTIKAAKIGAAGAVVAALVTIFGSAIMNSGDDKSPPPPAPSSPTYTTPETPSSEPPTHPPTDPVTETPTLTPEPQTKYLSKMEVISEQSPSDGAAKLAGETYSESIARRIGGCSEKSELIYELDKQWTKFDATVGVTSDSDSDAHVYFQVYVDGKKTGPQYKTTKFKTESVNLDVSGGLELTLVSTFVEGDMGICSNAGYAAWGDAQLSK